MSTQSKSEIYTVKIKPNSKKNEIEEEDFAKNFFKIRIKAPPEKGKANQELVKFLSKHLKKKVEIVSGFTSREKRVKIF